MKIANKVKKTILDSTNARAKLMIAFNEIDATVKRLIKTDHWKITTAIALQTMDEITALNLSKILVQEKAKSET